MKNLIHLTTLLLLLGMMPGCTKEKLKPKPEPLPYPLSELPLPTQEGKGTFGCVINGEPWVAIVKPSHPWIFPLRATYDEAHYGADFNRKLNVSAHRVIGSYDFNNDSIFNALGFTLTPINSAGYYDIHNLDTYSTTLTLARPAPTKIYKLDTLAPFHVHITILDTIKKIVSGTFEMDLRRTIDTNEVLQIRHGRFDAKYQKE